MNVFALVPLQNRIEDHGWTKKTKKTSFLSINCEIELKKKKKKRKKILRYKLSVKKMKEKKKKERRKRIEK